MPFRSPAAQVCAKIAADQGVSQAYGYIRETIVLVAAVVIDAATPRAGAFGEAVSKLFDSVALAVQMIFIIVDITCRDGALAVAKVETLILIFHAARILIIVGIAVAPALRRLPVQLIELVGRLVGALFAGLAEVATGETREQEEYKKNAIAFLNHDFIHSFR